MRVPGLIRFGAATDAYIGNTNGGPRMYFNIEDHLAHSTGVRNVAFEARCPVLCKSQKHSALAA